MARARENLSDHDLPLLKWRPPSKVQIFPTHRRADFVRCNARRMTDLVHEKAVAHLDRTLAIMADRMRRLEIHPEAIGADIEEARVAVLALYTAMGGGRS